MRTAELVTNKPALTMLVATELTTEDLLDLFIEIAKQVTYQRDRARKDADMFKHEFEMYRSAWLREMGGLLINKHHDIDAFVLTTRLHYANSQRWSAYQNGLISRDPFWMVPEPSRTDDGIGKKL